MAAAGGKSKDSLGSVSLGSAKDFDHSCEPCLTIGQHVEAYGFCVDCQEYLCKTCLDCHKRAKFSRSHQLLDKDNFHKHVITNKGSEECTEKCQVHRKEIIKFFCLTHKTLGCNHCIIMGHRTCKIEYIPETCTGIGDSDEYRDTMRKLNEKIEEAESVMKKAKIRETEIEECHSDVIKQIIDFRKEINDIFDQLQQAHQKIVDKKKSNDKKLIQNVLEECSNISSEIKKLQSSIQANKTSGENGQLYINIKRAISKLKSDEVKEADENLSRTDTQFTFKRNTDMKKLLLKGDAFGALYFTDILATQVKSKIFDNLTHKEDINVKSKSDKIDCHIIGSALLPSNKLVLADSYNKKLKCVDTKSKTVTEEKTLDSYPWDIAAIARDQIAVTMPKKRKILVMSTSSHLSVVRSIPVDRECRGITYHQGCLYVVCKDPKSVLVLDTRGNAHNTITLKNGIFQYPEYIVVSKDSRRIYISESHSDCVVSITLKGAISAIYKHEDLNGIQGMVMLDDGSLMVCCFSNDSIHHIAGDLKQGQTVIDDIPQSRSISYSHHDEKIFIGGKGNLLKVYDVK